jgi:hypothetical protein
MGRTVVEPLTLMLCFWPEGAGVAAVVFVPVPVHPAAAIAKISNAARLRVTIRVGVRMFTVFIHDSSG